MRIFLSCLICRIVTLLLKIMGRGATTLPGKAALKVKRNILTVLSKDTKVIIVTGTNGKTTSCRILEEGLKKAGKDYFINKSGANLITGITSSFIMNSTVFGKCKKSCAIIECDENAFKEVSRYIRADVVLVTNIFRDQLDRYGEVTHTLSAIKESVKNLPDAVICLNADCSLTYSISKEIPNKILTFGVNIPFGHFDDTVSDARYCLYCRHEYNYSYHTYGHLGGFECQNCGYRRPEPDYAVTAVMSLGLVSSRVKAKFVDNEYGLAVNMGGTHNVYNAIGCSAALSAFGIDDSTIRSALENFNGAFGRMEDFDLGNGHKLHIILVKNPAGFTQTTNYLSGVQEESALIFSLNDNIADGRDVSWIWDGQFSGILEKENFTRIYAAGKRCYDMALRIKYEGTGGKEINILEGEDYSRLLDEAISLQMDVYIVPTYTSMMAMRPVIASRLGGKEFWK